MLITILYIPLWIKQVILQISVSGLVSHKSKNIFLFIVLAGIELWKQWLCIVVKTIVKSVQD